MADEWELYYHGRSIVSGPGRAEFARLMFEELGIKYTEVGEKIRELFVQGQLTGYPSVAPPMIKKGDFQLSQTGVICRYLGKKYGLYPEADEDEWHAEQVMATITDYIAEGRLAFHGKNYYASYFQQKEETQPYIKLFVETRIPKFLSHFEKVLASNKSDQGFVVGGKCTYVDIGLLHALRATEGQFPDTWKELKEIPLLRQFKEMMCARPNLSAYFKSDRARPFEGNSMM